MKRFIIAAAVSVAALSTAQAAVIDFEGLTTENQYNLSTNPDGIDLNAAFDGITFSSNEVGEDLFLIKTGPPQDGFVPDDTVAGNVFGEYFLGTEFNDTQTNLTIEFDTPTLAASFQVADIDDDEEFTFTAFNDDGTMSSVVSISAINGDPGTGNGAVATVGFSNLGFEIASIVIDGTRSSNRLGIAFDNFNTASDVTVPLPAAAPLFAAGFAGLAAMRRRRRQG
jgi:opacity protein-like surface antigen